MHPQAGQYPGSNLYAQAAPADASHPYAYASPYGSAPPYTPSSSYHADNSSQQSTIPQPTPYSTPSSSLLDSMASLSISNQGSFAPASMNNTPLQGSYVSPSPPVASSSNQASLPHPPPIPNYEQSYGPGPATGQQGFHLQYSTLSQSPGYDAGRFADNMPSPQISYDPLPPTQLGSYNSNPSALYEPPSVGSYGTSSQHVSASNSGYLTPASASGPMYNAPSSGTQMYGASQKGMPGYDYYSEYLGVFDQGGGAYGAIQQGGKYVGPTYSQGSGYDQGYYDKRVGDDRLPSKKVHDYDDLGLGEVYAYDGGNVEPYGARGTGTGGTWAAVDRFNSGNFDSYGSSGSSKLPKAVPKVEAEEKISGVQKYRVKMHSDASSSGPEDVLCQIGLDGVRMISPSTGKTVRIYPLETITRWEVHEPSVFTFWAKSSVDIEPRRIRLKSGSYTTNAILDTLTAACVQFSEMVGKMEPSKTSVDGDKTVDQNSEKKKNFVSWMQLNLYINKGRWEAYNDEVSAAIQISFAAQKKSARFIVSGQYYVVDFSHMMQLNLQTGFLRSIAWVDSSGKLVAPARRLEGCSRHWLSLLQTISQRASVVHAEEKSATPQELFEYSRCDTSAGCPQRKDDCQSAQESCNEGFLELGNGVCLLKKDDSDYFFVKEKFISGLGSLSRYTSVMSIHRCVFERTTAQVRLETFRKQMQAVASSRGDANVRYAWHGTSKKGIQGIISHGFGKSGVPKHGAICGSGFYLAPEGNSLRSLINSDMDEQGTQYMLLCKVIMGGTDEIQLEGQQFSPSSEDYDTCVDITERPSQFTWTAHMNTHILPQFIVKFKLSEPWQALLLGRKIASVSPSACCLSSSQPSRVTEFETSDVEIEKADRKHVTPHDDVPWMTFQELFSMMKKNLDPCALLTLEQLHGEFQAGRLPRKAFVNVVRAVAGDALLLECLMATRMHALQHS